MDKGLKVSFYVLPWEELGMAMGFIHDLLSKIEAKNMSTIILLDSIEELERLDELLWVINEESFLAHTADTKYLRDTPIFLSLAKANDFSFDVCFNLTSNPVEGIVSASRIIEIVYSKEASKQQSRKKFKHYKSITSTISTHNIKNDH